MVENIEIKELNLKNINESVLDGFNRYQKIKRTYRKENGKWVVKDIGWVADWDKNEKKNKTNEFKNIVDKNEGYIWGAYENKELIGFAVLLNKRFGSKEQYIQLEYLHVSHEYRHKGIGKKLFELCIKKAKGIGIKKIYISANTSEESQRFYLNIGCKDAMETNKELEEHEPYDRQMEYEIT
jgi:N-acetylglutamate synthase-like GNAT family acetyltransferase